MNGLVNFVKMPPYENEKMRRGHGEGGGGGSDGRVVPDADISLLLWELPDMMSASEGGRGSWKC